jgi:predicted lysophospholipase L1 biosynthesis ABC-type transport system permease subunit
MARGQIEAEAILGVALALTTVGLAGTAVWMAWLLARLLASKAPWVPALLGLRRLEADPSSSARMVGGVAVLVALVGVVNAGWLAEPSASMGATLAPWVQALPPTDVIVVPFAGTPLPQMASIASTPGVTSVRMTRQLPNAGEFSRRITGVIETDGRPSTLEGIRQAVGWVASVDTVHGLRSAASTVRSDAELLGTPLRLVTFFLLAVIGASFLVALVDWIMERRRSLAVLSALGVSRAVIRASLLVQIAVPLVTSTLMGVIGGLAVTFLLYTAVESKVVFPLSQLATIAGGVIAMIGGTTALAAPWLRTTRRAELLRNE